MEDTIFKAPALTDCGTDLATMRPLPGQEAALTAVRELFEYYEGADDMAGLVLMGPPGTGKTHLAYQAWFPQWKDRRDRHGKKDADENLKFVRWAALLRTVQEEKCWWRAKAFEQVMEAHIVVADDVPRPRSPIEADILATTVTERYADIGSGATWLTTNLNRQQLREEFGDRAVDRLRHRGLWLVLDGPSHREPETPEHVAAEMAAFRRWKQEDSE